MADYDVVKAFKRIEDELISSMIANLKHHRAEETNEGIQWTQWQTEQLKALVIYKKQNKEKYSDKFTEINSNIESAIQKAYVTGGMEQEIKILKAIQKGYKGYIRAFKGTTATDGNFFKVNERKLNALIESTVNDMQKAEHAVLRRAEDQYRKIIFDAQVYANSGGVTYEKAVDMATHDFLSAGIRCIEYKNGARHTIADYADMAIKTATKRAYLRGEGTKRNEWGIHTVIVNKRSNPCPLCLPFVAKILIDDVYSGGSSADGDYPLVSTAMEMGFLHPRCKDHFTTYFEGISTPPKEQQLTQADLLKIKEQNELEKKKRFAENQQKRMKRLAKHSLDKDNKKIYSSRADEWQKKSEEISEKLNKPVEKSTESGIIELSRKNALNYRFAVSQERIDSVIEDDLKGIKFTSKPVYNPRIRDNGKTTIREYYDGTVKEIVKVEIGKQDKSSAEFLEDTILHEELEARIAIRSKYSERYNNLYNSNDIDRHKYINKIIERYFKIKGWNYELV